MNILILMEILKKDIYMNDLVSILVPVYGVEKYIERCALSLFEQTYKNIEYIFVDDCSPDNSVSVLKKVVDLFPSRKKQVFIIKHEHNQGLAAARNTALEYAHGKYVMHVDSDDFIDKTTVEKAMQKMYEESADIVIFGMNHVYKNKSISEMVEIPSDPKVYAAKLLARECPVCVCGGLYLRSLYMNNGVRAIPGLNMGEDYATKPRLVYYAKRIASIKEPLYSYVHYNEGAYSYTLKNKYIDDLMQALQVLESFFKKSDNPAFFTDSIKKAKIDIWFLLLTSWGIHHGNKIIWKRLQNLFNFQSLSNISFKKRVMIYFAQHNKPFLVKGYANCGVLIKKILK